MNDGNRGGHVAESPRFYTLDGIRGVAAIAVFFHHAKDLVFPLSAPAAYRAVDLFFVLSGIVLAHAYERRLKTGCTVSRFYMLRMVRLYPLFLLSALIAVAGATLAFLLGGGHMTAGALAVASISLLLMLPSPTWGQSSDVMPLNPPGWSLLCEMIVNTIYATIVSRLSTSRLVLLIALSAIWLVIEAIHAGSANIGSEWSGITGGLARVMFSFFIGVFMMRVRGEERRVIITRFAWILTLTVIPAFVIMPGNIFVDLTIICVFFPFIVWTSSFFQPKSINSASILGEVSYPLYVLHAPIIAILYRASSYFNISINKYAPWPALMLLFALLLLSRILDIFYDRKVRRYIMRKLKVRIISNIEPRLVK